MGCQLSQGFLQSKPLTPDELITALTDGRLTTADRPLRPAKDDAIDEPLDSSPSDHLLYASELEIR